MTRAAIASPPDPSRLSPTPVWRLSDPASFAALGRTRDRVRSGPLTVSRVAATLDEPPRVAYAIAKRVGNAVVRNRLRRRLRTVVSQLQPPPGAYLIGAQPAAALLSSSDLKALVSHALQALPSSTGRLDG